MGNYDFSRIEKKWQKYWKENRTFVAEKSSDKPKYYIMDMFPYPSGAGLHVGHPLGYIATDILTRYKRLKGFNVLHPMGFDAFGLPAEQYAIKTGIHPAEVTKVNTKRYQEQMEVLGFHYDPETAFRTSDPDYYKWTQWIFLQLFKTWFDKSVEKAQPIETLIAKFEENGNMDVEAATTQKRAFTADEWKQMSEKEQADIIMNYRLAYIDFATVNWCPALGTVLANEEVKEGRSERGNHPVVRKQMRQWMLRITAYGDRLLAGLDELDWPEAIKAMQTHWIGRSEGSSIIYDVEGTDEKIEVYTTRPDTIYGNTFMVLAPEHPLVAEITTDDQKQNVDEYITWATNRSERDRLAETKKTGVWTGGYAIHPFSGKKLPIWISDYVLITYGTGAIMAVPAHDERDYEFAHKFGIDIIEVISGGDISKEAYTSKDGIMVNSPLIDGMKASEAIPVVIAKFEEMGIGKGETNYRFRDVIWSRQRYWGEPTPIVYKNDIAYAIDESELPLILPDIESYLPSETGEPPLSRAEDWVKVDDETIRDMNTMPGWAGSSWYFLRYPDPFNEDKMIDEERAKYWLPIDLYIGGTEHAVTHLLYSRFWNKFLFDIGEIPNDEPFKKLINQGKIQGVSEMALRNKESGEYYSADLVDKKDRDQYDEIHTNIAHVDGNKLDTEAFKAWSKQPELVFHTNADGQFITIPVVEKMSKSFYNTVNPDDMCEQYGTDTFRMYEMFLGPIEMDKPWNTDGISGVQTFMRKAMNLFTNDKEEWIVTDDAPTAAELKILHKTIKKVEEGMERMAFNTCVPAFMVFARDIAKLKCHKRAILEPFVKILSPFAPHFCEEMWERMGHQETILKTDFPQWKEEYIAEDEITYPVQVNGKVRAKINAPADADKDAVEEIALANETVIQWMDGKPARKVIVVPGRIVNIVV
jgi:leucyl-tRNA synthetase